MENWKTDLMGIIDYSLYPKFEPYEIENGWTVVLPGENNGRKKKHGRKLVAESKIEIQLSNISNVLKCIQVLEESDRRLSESAGTDGDGNGYDWQLVAIKGLKVRFGVSWYDIELFNSKKDIWSKSDHSSMFKHFGASVEDFKVEHFVKE